MLATGFIRRLLACLIVLSSAPAIGPVAISAMAQQPGIDGQDDIVVHLISGRTMTAKIDARTDAGQLWLRWESPGAEVLRPIQWECVTTAEINGDNISGKEFFDLVDQIRRDVPAQPASAPITRSIVMLGSPAEKRGSPGSRTWTSKEGSPGSRTWAALPEEADRAMQNHDKTSWNFAPPVQEPVLPGSNNKQEPKPPVQWLDIDARPARWDNYVDIDGMSICIAPKDAYGQVIPVRGTLDVDLIAEHAGVDRLPYPFSRIAHWSQAVRPEDFGPSGAVYKLPFQDVNPEFDNHLGPHGAIHATLSVPGQDTFEATADARIRPYSLIRDRLLQTTGRRFFPEETIGLPWEKK
jgi:hypothetical protein